MYFPPRLHFQEYFTIQKMLAVSGILWSILVTCIYSEKYADELKSAAHDLEDNDGVMIAQMNTIAVLSGNTFLGLMSCIPVFMVT